MSGGENEGAVSVDRRAFEKGLSKKVSGELVPTEVPSEGQSPGREDEGSGEEIAEEAVGEAIAGARLDFAFASLQNLAAIEVCSGKKPEGDRPVDADHGA